MTYPPQQPGPYGQQPPQGPYGQQPDPFGNQPAYQGFGGYPGGGEPPRPNNTGKIVAIVAIAVLVLGGAATGVYFLTKGDDKGTTSAPGTSAPQETSESKAKDSTATKPAKPTTTSKASAAGGPEEVVDAYIDAYEKKDFSRVVEQACDAYKKKYGTDTSELESQLSKFEVKGEAKGAPEVKGSTATAEIDLELTEAGKAPKPAHIRIKVVKEDGGWRFCGEETA